MRTRVVLMFLFLSALFATASRGEEPAKKKAKEPTGDLAAIHAAIDSYVDAFNAADAERVAAHWSDEAVYIRSASGEKVTGRKAIAKVFGEIFAGERSRLRVAVDSIRLITPEVAIEDGTAWVVSAAGGEERSTYTAVHVKGKGGWKLDSVRETEAPAEAEAPAGYEQLKELEWMLGNWVDAGDDATVEYSANWAKNHTFIVRLFKVSAPGAADLEGTQVIGWDAHAKSIRSWVFDSAGGFSEGTWSRKGDAWVVNSSGYTSEGQRTSSTAVFKQVDANTLTWSMSGRKVGDEKLSDIPAVNIVRK